MKRTLDWQIATISHIKRETPRAKSVTLKLPDWQPHQAGQHYDVRLTAEDGYQVQRSYSIASEPQRVGEIDLTIERIEGGEVSPYVHDVLMEGDLVEVRGPIGGYFVWEPTSKSAALLIAGGSGVVPLMAIARNRAAVGSSAPMRLLYSSRAPDDAIFFDELSALAAKQDGFEVFHTFTRQQPPGWKGFARRIDADMLREVAGPLKPGLFGKPPQVFVCGPTALVESAANTLVKLGFSASHIKTERFGPSGS